MSGNETSSYCHDIETYLCRKNDGHLVRVVGPSFDVVSRWAAEGIPLKVAFAGIDRYFERYYRKGPRRRPVRIEFCDADVLDVFDEWRRALGLSANRGTDLESVADREDTTAAPRQGQSLPAHLERVLLRLSSARALGTLGPEFDALLDRVSSELDTARANAKGLRGAARQQLIARLGEVDRELMRCAGATFDPAELLNLERIAENELSAFKSQMAPERFARTRDAAVIRLIRDRLHLPTVSFE